MTKAVLDSTILVSAFISPKGSAGALVWQVGPPLFQMLLSQEIITECRETLLRRPHIRKRYKYSDTKVERFVSLLPVLSLPVFDLPSIQVVRDPNDNFVLATAIKGEADYLVSRDKDLLSIGRYQTINIVDSAYFLQLLRAASTHPPYKD